MTQHRIPSVNPGQASSDALVGVVLNKALPYSLRRVALRYLLSAKAADQLDRIAHINGDSPRLQLESALFLAMVRSGSALCSVYESL